MVALLEEFTPCLEKTESQQKKCSTENFSQTSNRVGSLLSQATDIHQVNCYDAQKVMSDGTIYEYSPFGKVIAKTGSYADENTYRFSTKSIDVETDLYYYGYRYYDSKTGRWLNRDPINEAGGFNIYGMVNNDPVNLWDYLGMKICKKELEELDALLAKNNLTDEELDRIQEILEKFKHEESSIFDKIERAVDATSAELGMGLGLKMKGKFGPIEGQLGGDMTLSNSYGFDGSSGSKTEGSIGASLSYKNHSIGAQYGGSAGFENDKNGRLSDTSKNDSVLGYKNSSGNKEFEAKSNGSSSSYGGSATVLFFKVGVSFDSSKY